MPTRRSSTLLLLALTGCGGYFPTYLPPFDDGSDAALAPLASAGADREILWGYPARLDASGTHHPSGRGFSMRWQQLDEGERVHLSNAWSTTPTFLAPLTEQTLRFALIADDGTLRTSDEVQLVVKKDPSLVAPRVRAGPDRFLGYSDEADPVPGDVVEATDGAELSWTLVTPTLSEQGAADQPPPEPSRIAVHRVVAVKDGLESAPDYLVLRPFANDDRGRQAPVASIAAPGTIEPGHTFMADATDSTDANGDPLTFRWELVRGDVVLDEDIGGRVRSITAAENPQEVVMRVFASDGVLESAPASASIVVTAAQIAPPAVSPLFDVRGHPGNVILLDARPQTTAAAAFTWNQTSGEPVELAFDAGGRLASFTAPPVGVLGVSVLATVEGDAVTVEGDPAVTRVDVVPIEDNWPPHVYVCPSTSTPEPGQTVLITARISDPESDRRGGLVWSRIDNEDEGTRATLPERDGTPAGSSLCDVEAGAADVSQVELTAPATSGDVVKIRVEVWDALDARASAEVTLRVN